jgi:hypothetical protein
MIHINKYLDKIKMLESKQSKTFNMSMREAKDLHTDITKLLLVLQTLQTPKEEAKQDIEYVEISGGNFTDN